MRPYWSDGAATIWHGNALDLPLEDSSVDLVVTSPPYFGLRSYQDGGEHYTGQIGSEPTPAEFVDALIAATREMVRVLKPSGSLWINLGDKYASNGGHRGSGQNTQRAGRKSLAEINRAEVNTTGVPTKSLVGIPWRYALRCIDDLGLILRAEVIWSKPNGLPESVTDRVRRSHEQWFHFTKEPRYYSAVDEVREEHTSSDDPRWMRATTPANPNRNDGGVAMWRDGKPPNPLGKLPGSVWTIPTQPLRVPAHLGVDHFAAFPMEWPRRIIRGWSPRDVCTACGEGRRPTGERDRQPTQRVHNGHGFMSPDHGGRDTLPHRTLVTITGYACACTPYTDHEGETGPGWQTESEHRIGATGKQHVAANYPPRGGPWREYHWHDWTPAPTTPGVVLDPFGGTGTTALVAVAEGRTAHHVDLSADYCRLAQWRITDPGERARAREVEKPPVEINGQAELFEELGA